MIEIFFKLMVGFTAFSFLMMVGTCLLVYLDGGARKNTLYDGIRFFLLLFLFFLIVTYNMGSHIDAAALVKP